MVAVTLLLLAASSPAQASTSPQSLQRAAAANLATALPTGTWCTSYHRKSYISAWGYVRMGYVEIDVGVCYDTSTWQPTIIWGPYCSSGWYVPFARTSALNYCGWYYDGYGITVYGSWTAQIWFPPFGWTGDRTFWYSYGI